MCSDAVFMKKLERFRRKSHPNTILTEKMEDSMKQLLRSFTDEEINSMSDYDLHETFLGAYRRCDWSD